MIKYFVNQIQKTKPEWGGKLVLSVPAYFFSKQRNEVKNAGMHEF